MGVEGNGAPSGDPIVLATKMRRGRSQIVQQVENSNFDLVPGVFQERNLLTNSHQAFNTHEVVEESKLVFWLEGGRWRQSEVHAMNTECTPAKSSISMKRPLYKRMRNDTIGAFRA